MRALALLVLLALWPARAWANGAFPDSLSILLPRGQPDKITLATNFGLVFTSDGGRTWEWTCEHDSSLGAILYQLAPPPRQNIFALGLDLVRSDDDGCTWKAAGGRVASGFLYDLFVDPNDGQRVLALADPNDETPTRVHVFESTDGGDTFPVSLFEAQPGLQLRFLEVPLGEPGTLYLSWDSSMTGTLRSGLIRLEERGAKMQVFDHTPVLGGEVLGIAAVDRQDPRKIFLRAFGTERDRLAISEDGGATVRLALEANRSLAGLVVRPDGAVFAATRDLGGGALHVSRDGGKTFPTVLPGPRFRALAERDGRLFAAADEPNDGYALATSDDDGQTWKPLMRYLDVTRVKSCPGTALPQACTGTCMRLAFLNIFQPQVCPFSTPADAGAPVPDAAVMNPAPPRGCGCALGGREDSPAGLLLLLTLIGRAAACRERRRVGSKGPLRRPRQFG
jgi:hypothetical protein